MPRPEPFRMDHRVDLYVPSQCGVCKELIPGGVRQPVLDDVKKRFDGWFGGHSEALIKGDWPLPDGTLAKEEVADVFSFCTEDAFREHAEDVDSLAIDVANRLTQDCVLRVFDGLRVALWPRTRTDQKAGVDCACAGSRPVLAGPRPVAMGLERASGMERMLILQSVLQSFSSLDHARKLFSELLNYDLTEEPLPGWRDWPKELQARLVGSPQVICYTRGFKIVHLHLKNERLLRGWEREVAGRIIRDADGAFYGLFVVSNEAKTAWELVNVKLAEGDASKRVFRRMPVGGNRGARTATERLSRVSLEGRDKLKAMEIQGLHDDAFDVEAVTKEFYRRIADWYFWALQRSDVRYPRNVRTDAEKSIFFIRMLTRMIFCWFIREKGLIPQDLLARSTIEKLLKDTSAHAGTFYKAFLQNLFFATLNQESDKRCFRKKNEGGRDGNRGATNLYRYADLLTEPDTLLDLLRQVPFVNGGLFECLDQVYTEKEGKPDIRLDDFSEEKENRICIPNELLLAREQEMDLSEVYGDTKHRQEKVSGLLDILGRYQFTIEENTPLDQAVALDPELLGKVFENLLASYNEETRTTARKALGAFYTPREIVDYMVDESLATHFQTQLGKAYPEGLDVEARVRQLLNPADDSHQFSKEEAGILIKAIDRLRALDPAVGSGAFPMGILHRLVFILGKLDPGNELWKERQVQRVRDAMRTAEEIEDTTIRERTLEELEQQITGINEAFERNELDYGRKLFLIENCVYGVDIQPIAVQIARMRFFISLIVDQRVDPTAPNQGVRPLPNLETKFVAADSLVALEHPDALPNQEVDRLKRELAKTRHDFFSAKTPRRKSACRDRDRALRMAMARVLRENGFPSAVGEKLAAWDPYDQNASAGFFDPDWMFGIGSGFDVVIGNPPFGVAFSAEAKAYLKASFSTMVGKYDSYGFFIEQGLRFVTVGGLLVYITPHTWLTIKEALRLRLHVLREHTIRSVLVLADPVFGSAVVDTAIVMLSRGRPTPDHQYSARCAPGPDLDRAGAQRLVQHLREHIPGCPIIGRGTEAGQALLSRLLGRGRPLKDLASMCVGVQAYDRCTGQSAEVIKKRAYHSDSRKDGTYRRELSGQEVHRYWCAWASGSWISYGDWLAHPRKPWFFCGERIVVREITDPGRYRLFAAITEEDFVSYKTVLNVKISDELPRDALDHTLLVGILNSRLISWMLMLMSNKEEKRTFPRVSLFDLKRLPIVGMHDRTRVHQLRRLVTSQMSYAARNNSADPDTDARIDELVYALYDLTADEIKVVEEGTAATKKA